MEKLQADIQGKVKLLKFTLGKTDEVVESNSALAINRHRDALNTLVGSIDQLRYHGTPKLTTFSKNTLLSFSDRYYSNLSFTKSFRKKDCFYATLWTKKG